MFGLFKGAKFAIEYNKALDRNGIKGIQIDVDDVSHHSEMYMFYNKTVEKISIKEYVERFVEPIIIKKYK